MSGYRFSYKVLCVERDIGSQFNFLISDCLELLEHQEMRGSIGREVNRLAERKL